MSSPVKLNGARRLTRWLGSFRGEPKDELRVGHQHRCSQRRPYVNIIVDAVLLLVNVRMLILGKEGSLSCCFRRERKYWEI